MVSLHGLTSCTLLYFSSLLLACLFACFCHYYYSLGILLTYIAEERTYITGNTCHMITIHPGHWRTLHRHTANILWHLDSLLDNARNTHAANSIGTVFPSSADGLLLCNARADVTQQYVAVTLHGSCECGDVTQQRTSCVFRLSDRGFIAETGIPK
jgi:hypothetical protein